MSGVPTEIADVGSTAQKLSQNPGFDPLRAGLSTEDYFVWSRFDGATSLKDLLLMTGFPVEHAIAIVKKLRGLGAVLLPGENPATMAAKAAPAGAPRASSPAVSKIARREPEPRVDVAGDAAHQDRPGARGAAHQVGPGGHGAARGHRAAGAGARSRQQRADRRDAAHAR